MTTTKDKLENADEAKLKITSKNKFLLDEIITCLNCAFVCTPQSQKMYSEDLDALFQYFKVARREEQIERTS